jgi:hypothetical protein
MVWIVTVKWTGYYHVENATKPLLAYGKTKRTSATLYQHNLELTTPANDLFDAPIFKMH